MAAAAVVALEDEEERVDMVEMGILETAAQEAVLMELGSMD